MTPNHPIPPERIRAEAERVVREMYEKDAPEWKFSNLPVPSQVSLTAYVRAGIEHGASLVDVSAVQREAARKAWDAATRWIGVNFVASAAGRDAYLDREHPAPAPEGVTLSDGSVVTVTRNIAGNVRLLRHNGDGDPNKECPLTVPRDWRGLLLDTDAGADFDALKAFAAKVGAA